VLALWMIAVVAILSVSISEYVRQKIALSDRLDRRNWLAGIAETGVTRVLYKLRQKKEAAEGYHGLNDTYTSAAGDVRMGEGALALSYPVRNPWTGQMQMRYGVEDEEGRFNVNVIDGKRIAKFIEVVAEAEEDQAKEIAYAIVDWRDTNDSLSDPKFGAEDDDYEDLDPPYEAKDQPFESLDELLLVRGMTPEIFERIQPFVTIYGPGTVNINTAPMEVLMGLGMSKELAGKVVMYRAGQDGEEGTSDDRVFMQAANVSTELMKKVKLAGAESTMVSQMVSKGQLGVDSTHFRIRSQGKSMRKKQILEIEAVADTDGVILSWSVSSPRRMSAPELSLAATGTQEG
jgi:type II secretory pathway component PulK